MKARSSNFSKHTNRSVLHHEPMDRPTSYSSPSQRVQAPSSSKSSYRTAPREVPQSLTSPGSVATELPNTDMSVALYGGSSTNFVVSHIQQATTKGNASVNSGLIDSITSDPGSQLYAEYTTSGPEIIRDQNISNFVLPHRQTADEFVRCYWEFLHPLFPVLHKQTFLARYEELWLSADSVAGRTDHHDGVSETNFYVSLNLVLALGCQFSNIIMPAKRSSYANEFYQRSRKVINFEILDSTQLSLVQMLLLTGIYLQSTEHATRLWNVVGLAIRAAQGLGLHSNEASIHLESQLDREIRRRVWHTCVVLDRSEKILL
jgi:hypothetical protein